MRGFSLPGLDQIEKIQVIISEYIKFSHDAMLTTIRNQHAIHARLAAIEASLALPEAVPLGEGPPPILVNGAAPLSVTANEGATP